MRLLMQARRVDVRRPTAAALGDPRTRAPRAQADETDDYLLIVGRPKEEVVPTGSVRPIHPNEPSWTPQVGTRCEYLFAEGWWTVMVEKALKGNKWQVVYEPHQVTYKATRAELRRDTLRDP